MTTEELAGQLIDAVKRHKQACDDAAEAQAKVEAAQKQSAVCMGRATLIQREIEDIQLRLAERLKPEQSILVGRMVVTSNEYGNIIWSELV